jgi:holo-[acyl-carrier protein] synthase
MGIVCVGIDLTSVSAVRRSIDSFGERYLRRVFTANEITQCATSADPVPHLAARFAAKEATIKALRVDGTQPPWNSIEVRRQPEGWCLLHLDGAAARIVEARGITELTLSLSHEGDIAAAVVVATAHR